MGISDNAAGIITIACTFFIILCVIAAALLERYLENRHEEKMQKMEAEWEMKEKDISSDGIHHVYVMSEDKKGATDD